MTDEHFEPRKHVYLIDVSPNSYDRLNVLCLLNRICAPSIGMEIIAAINIM